MSELFGAVAISHEGYGALTGTLKAAFPFCHSGSCFKNCGNLLMNNRPCHNDQFCDKLFPDGPSRDNGNVMSLPNASYVFKNHI